jgi:mersacidin/lichenicidin family type 2 lantibiotic
MSNLDIIRAWKDPEFRATLADVPPHPAGEIEIEPAGLGLDVHPTAYFCTFGCFTAHTCTHEQECG